MTFYRSLGQSNPLKLQYILKRSLLVLTTLFLLPLLTTQLQAKNGENFQEKKTHTVRKILRVEINSSINPATYSYLKETFKEAEKKSSDLILIEMNTPGGLVTVTKDILTLFGESDRPVVVWVSPEGASATSAGAIIASGAHLLYMSEGTNIGAATPIQMGKDIDKKSDMRKKAINDLVALVQSLSEARGRNPAPFGEMIEKASSFSAREALKNELINDIVNTESDLLSKIHNTPIRIKGTEKTLLVDNPIVIDFPMDLGQKLLNVLANPSTAYVLFLIGAALLYLEFQAPGGFIAGAVGAVSLLLAGIGFQVLPLNFGALGLMVISFVLFVMEAFITSYGILSLAGLASLVAGSLFLFRTDDAYLTISTSFILAVVAAVCSFLGLCAYFIIKERKNIGKEKFNSAEGRLGKVVKAQGEEGHQYVYQVKVGGEVWKATSEVELNEGEEIKVIEKYENSMKLKVEKA